MNKYLIPAAVVVLIAIAVIASFTLSDSAKQTPSTPTVTQQPQGEEELASESSYNDGTYREVGNYVSPGGPREINVSVTLDNGVITDATFEGLATDPTSKRFQGEFGDNFKTMVVGKNIDEVSLTKVAGSSLTPIGFTDALNKIKAQAEV